MKEKSQVDQFSDDLDKFLYRTRLEYDLSYAEVIGTLFVKTQWLATELILVNQKAKDE